MRELLRLFPRKYRTLAVRIFLLVACLLVLYVFLPSDHVHSGAGREDQPLFRFGDDAYDDESRNAMELQDYDGIIDQKLEAVAPKKHLGQDFEKIANEHKHNVTEPPLIEPEVGQDQSIF